MNAHSFKRREGTNRCSICGRARHHSNHVTQAARGVTLASMLLLLSGCQLAPVTRVEEAAYQVLAFVDYGQTSNVASRPDCLHELGPAQTFIGHQPDEGHVTGYFALMGTSHYFVTRWLQREVDATDSRGWAWALHGWEIGSIVLEGVTVANNYKRGVRPFAPRCPHET